MVACLGFPERDRPHHQERFPAGFTRLLRHYIRRMEMPDDGHPIGRQRDRFDVARQRLTGDRLLAIDLEFIELKTGTKKNDLKVQLPRVLVWLQPGRARPLPSVGSRDKRRYRAWIDGQGNDVMADEKPAPWISPRLRVVRQPFRPAVLNFRFPLITGWRLRVIRQRFRPGVDLDQIPLGHPREQIGELPGLVDRGEIFGKEDP